MARDESELVTKGLSWLPRLAAALVGAAFAGFSVAYAIRPPDVLVAAGNCEGAPVGCAVKVSGQAAPAFIVATALLGALFLLIAITGVMFKLVLPGGGSLEPIAQTVKDKPADVRPVTPDGSAGLGTTAETESEPEAKNELWLSLPPSVRGAAEKLWFEWDPSTTTAPAQALLQVERKNGKGPHPYYLTFRTADAQQRIVKVTLSGRGYTGPRAFEDN